jgi:hypothetical protein
MLRVQQRDDRFDGGVELTQPRAELFWGGHFSGTRKPGTVEWGFAHLAKRKEMADKKDPAAPVLGGEASLAGAKPSTKSVKKGKLPPKNESRLPRRQKKAQQKAAGRL